MAVTTLLSFFGILTVVTAQINFPGKCNNVTTQQNFDMKKYLGTWYEIEKYPTIFQSGASCIKTQYAPGKNNSMHVENFMSLYGYNLSVYGTMYEINPKLKDGKMKLNFPEVNSYDNEMWVLSTDYSNYSIVWHCTQYNTTNDQFAWVLSRTPNITEPLRMQINTILERNHLDLDKFILVNQTHCGRRGGKGSASSTRVSASLIVLMLITTFYHKLR